MQLGCCGKEFRGVQCLGKREACWGNRRLRGYEMNVGFPGSCINNGFETSCSVTSLFND
jgi:hypothetical protein